MSIIIENGTVESLITALQDSFTGLIPLISLFLSVPLGFFFVRKIISLIPKR